MGFWPFRRSLRIDDERSFFSGELEYESERLYSIRQQEQEQTQQQQQQHQQHESSETGVDPSLEQQLQDDIPSKPRDLKLIVAFIGLVITGTANSVLNKLQAVPLYNYPNFINIFGNFVFIPITFAYILPAYRYGWFNQSITRTQWTMSLRPFAIMGALDCVAGMMQVFSAVYLPGPLLVLLPQAAIPISTIFSKHIMGTRYGALQLCGSPCGPVGGSLLWSCWNQSFTSQQWCWATGSYIGNAQNHGVQGCASRQWPRSRWGSSRIGSLAVLCARNLLRFGMSLHS